MNYEKIYNSLVEKAKQRGLDKTQHEGYFEIHHIIPRCIGGSDDPDNLVMFTAREHFIAHILLWKIYPHERGIIYAAKMMCTRLGGKWDSKLYEQLRFDFSETQSEYLRGENHPMWGRKHSEETKKIMSEKAIGRKLSEETRRKISEVQTGKKLKPHSEETKRKISIANTGKIRTKEMEEKRQASRLPGFLKKKGITEEEYWEMKRLKAENPPMTNEERKRKMALPWNAPAWIKKPLYREKWLIAGFFYELWVMFDQPSFVKFARMCQEYLNDDSYTTYYFDRMQPLFKNGWVPQEDPDWVEFTEKYFCLDVDAVML